VRSILFPSISTGAYRYPIQEASRIAVETVRGYIGASQVIERVRFVCFFASDLKVYRERLS
jgi:O-acetyl-ADP-ribose deacetylase (regulator of RNase III)